MRVHHLALRTRQLDAVVAFYRDLLGLPVVREQPGYSVWLGLDDAVLMVERAGDDEAVVSGQTRELLAVAVDASGRARLEAALAARGLAIEERTTHTVYFRDPDGRRVGASTYPLPELGPRA